MPVPWEEAGRFGVVITDENGQINEFEEKPEKPRSNLASMGIYIFTWKSIERSTDPHEGTCRDVISESISCQTAWNGASGCLLMSTTDTGKM